MFNPEKLLGGLLGSVSRSSLKTGIGGGAGLGLLGVAMEAVDHYMNKSQEASRGQSAPYPGQGPSVPPSPPGGAASAPPMPPVTGDRPAPPPPPGIPQGAPPPPPASAGSSRDVESPEPGRTAVLLIRAMIAAANADGQIDQEERSRILDKLKAVELNPEEHAFIVNELLCPADLEAIVREVDSADLARQVYAVSLLAITVDTDAELNYMNTLADRLGLSGSDLDAIHHELGISI